MSDSQKQWVAHSPFWPIVLLGLSLVAFLGWQVTLGIKEYRAGLAMVDRQRLIGVQAADAEAKLQAMVLDLLELARTNTAANAIVEQFSIQYTPPAQPQP